jgi:AbrB family looped-hinge helix DNA binding protein
MRELLSTVTAKGQVTIPVEIRRLLKVKPHDKIAFILEGDQVMLMNKGSVIASNAGIIKTTQPLLTDKELREATERAIAEDVVERMGG